MKKKAKVDGPNHCIHCNEDPCMFIQIELHLGENDAIYFDQGEYEKTRLRTTVPDKSKRFSTQLSFCGKVSTTGNHTLLVQKMVYGRFSLPLMVR